MAELGSELPSKILRKYNNPCLKKAKDQLYADRIRTGDVKFIIGSEEIWAHCCVLAARSPKYNAQFYGSMPETGDIQVNDVTAAAFEEFLQFFYVDEITLTVDNIDDVLNLAKQSLVDSLVDQCTTFLLDTVNLEEVFIYLRLAIFHSLIELQEMCDELIGMNGEMVLESEDFLSCDRDILVHILSLDTLKCKETEVFEACMNWARAECNQNGIDETKPENLRNVLGDAFHKIRFGSMKYKEFATIHEMNPNLFTTDEANELFNVVCDSADSEYIKTPRKPKQPKQRCNTVEDIYIDYRVSNATMLLLCGMFICLIFLSFTRVHVDTQTTTTTTMHINGQRYSQVIYNSEYNMFEDSVKFLLKQMSSIRKNIEKKTEILTRKIKRNIKQWRRSQNL